MPGRVSQGRGSVFETLEALVEFAKIVRDDPRIGVVLAIMLIAGVVVAVVIRRVPRDEFPHIH
jgi:hypothetical protein